MTEKEALIYFKEKTAHVFGAIKHPERKTYYKIVVPALELAHISGDWDFYNEIKSRAWKKQIRIEEGREELITSE